MESIMGTVIRLDGWRIRKLQRTQAAPDLECPQCNTSVAATNVESNSTTTYRCAGHGHKPLTWRIDADGNMLRGAAGRRYY